MAPEEALLQAVLESPDADAPRLAYADRLEERGQPAMAEFIRLEVERARLPYTPVTDQARDLERRSQRLFRTHRAEWLGPLHKPKSKLITFSRSDRGLLHLTVRCTAASFLERAEDLLAGLVLPYTLDVWLTRVGALLPQILALPSVSRVTRLRFEGQGLGPSEAAALAGCERLRALQMLWLFDDGIGDAGTAALAASPHLTGLGTLWLEKCGVGQDGACALLEAPHPPGWTHLHDNPLDAATRKRLRASQPQRFSV